jgi:L-ascorbate metabolism protein UlaG (beta-lactamase superfamily)
MVKNIHWLGHDCFRIDGPPTIYIDPYKLPEEGLPKADLILITHDHFDHLSLPDLEKIRAKETVIVTVAAAAAKLKGNVKVVKPGDKLTVLNVPLEVVPAYNIGKKYHPKEAGYVGYILTVGGQRIYHAGDTDVIPEMKDFRVDIALLPISGTYVMTAAEAIEAVKSINPEVVIPMHYGTIVGSEKDAKYLAKSVSTEVVILKKE